MEFGTVNLCMVRPNATKSSSNSRIARAGALDGESLSHHWAAAGKHLEVGHAASARRSIVGGRSGGEATKGSWTCFLQERAHRA